jgi:hypothetical protein
MKNKKVIRLTESQLIDLIKQSISESSEFDSENKLTKSQYSLVDFMNITKMSLGDFNGKYKVENGKLYLKIPLPYNPLPLPFNKEWIEIK